MSHREHGILLMAGDVFRSGVELEEAHVVDIAPTILYLLGLPVSTYMDGKVLTQAINEEYLRKHPIQWTDERYQRGKGEASYSSEDETDIMERLKGLGYV